MWDEGAKSNWSQLAEEVMLKIREWREEHPKATFTEIEEAVDRLWASARARLIQDVALASDVKNINHESGDSCPLCPRCGRQLESRGEKVRKLSTNYGQSIELKRSYGVCPACKTGIFSPG